VALFAVGGAAAIGAYHGWRRRQVRYRAAALMAVIGCGVAPLGVLLATRLPDAILTDVFCAVMVLVAVRMLLATRQQASSHPAPRSDDARVLCRVNPATGKLRWTAACAMTVAAIGGIAGLCSGLLGVGGGFVIVPAMTRFSDVKPHHIIATSLLAIALIAVSSVASALLKGSVVDRTGLAFIVGSAAGMVLGRISAPLLSGPQLMRGFALLVLVVSVVLAFKS
jgi:uncharacterized membrane protein YfcA